jgi:hypothetical protein
LSDRTTDQVSRSSHRLVAPDDLRVDRNYSVTLLGAMRCYSRNPSYLLCANSSAAGLSIRFD